MRKDQDEKMQFQNTARGHMFATTMTGTTGFGGNFIVVDDPHNTAGAESEATRMESINFFDRTLTTRLNDKFRDVIVIVMQRLHIEDLTGHVLKHGGWEHLCLQGVAEEAKTITFPTSGRIVTRNDGDLLWPEREGPKQIEEARVSLTPYGFAGQYQQRPVPPGGKLFKTEWFQFFDAIRFLDEYRAARITGGQSKFERVVQSWDCAAKTGQRNDYSVCTTWIVTSSGYYLVDRYKDRVEFPDLKAAAIRLASQWNPDAIIIEDASNGQPLIQEFRTTVLPIVPFKPGSRDKWARANAVTPMVEAKKVFLPAEATWTADFLDTVTSFDSAPHDDDVDSMVQFLSYVRDAGNAWTVEEVLL
jgi:predicted phage terminase large subunit-like protein